MKKVEEKESNVRNILKTVFNIVFWVAITGLAIIWITEFILVNQEKEPMFCLETTIHEFEDGTVEECTGIGYKVYEYDRETLKATEFGPFFIKMEE